MVVVSEVPAVADAVDAACAELGELCGQRNAATARMVDLIARVDAAHLWASSGARSLEHWVAWKGGMSAAHASDLVTMARRAADLPVTMAGFRDGVLSEDQVAIIAKRAPEGPEADAHFAEVARHGSVGQLRTALQITRVSRPAPEPPTPATEPDEQRQVSSWFDDDGSWHLRADLPVEEGAFWDRTLRAELDELVREHKQRKEELAGADAPAVPLRFPRLVDAFIRLGRRARSSGDAGRAPSNRATVIVHVEAGTDLSELHLGPALSEAERQYLTCDARFETWFERNGTPIGVDRNTRAIPRRLRRALERRDRCCRVCGSTVGLHAHHLIHWEAGGPTELWNLVLLCPHCHRSHHRGLIRVVGPADHLQVFDARGRILERGSLARPPTGPLPDAPAYRHPPGERAEWKWYQPPPVPPSPC